MNNEHYYFRSLAVLLLTVVALGMLVTYPDEAEAVDNTGLVGYWSFNEGTSTTATDFSGRGNTGTLTSMASPATATSGWGNGKLGKALAFDGSNDIVSVGRFTPLETTSNTSFSLWFNARTFQVSGADYTGLLSYGLNEATSVIYMLGLRYDGSVSNRELVFEVQDAVSSYKTAVGSIVQTDKWYHVVGRYDGSFFKAYLNGTEVGSVAAPSAPKNGDASNILVLGRDLFNGAAARYFDGKIDDVRIYNRSLSPTEITTLYQSSSVTHSPPNNLGLVGYWPFNEATSTTAGDFSGWGNTGTLNTFAAPPTSASGWAVSGKRGGALRFDGGSDYVSANTGGSLNLTGSFTFSTWLYWDGTAGFHGILGKENGAANGYYFGLEDTGTLICGVNAGGGEVASLSTLRAGQWYQVACTSNGSTLVIYINGVQDNTAGSAAPGTNATAFTIGDTLAAATDLFDGMLDDVRVYNRALSGDEVAGIYTQGAVRMNASSATLTNGTSLDKGIVGLWTFDGGDTNWTTASAGVTYDRSGNNNTGTMTNMARAVAVSIGKLSQAFVFDGADDVVNAGTATTLDNIGNGANGNGLTVSAWIQPRTIGEGGFGRIVQKGTGITGGDLPAGGWAFYLFTTNAIKFSVEGASSHLERAGNSNSVTANAWQHVLITWDGVVTTAASSHIYVNGTEVSYQSTINGAGARSDDNTANFLVGNEPGGTLTFNGAIDDVRTYNRVLSAAEIRQLYLLGGNKIK
jgi:hypothetical protein